MQNDMQLYVWQQLTTVHISFNISKTKKVSFTLTNDIYIAYIAK